MFYIHVRQCERAAAFAVIGPYLTLEAAQRAAAFARLPYWTIQERTFGRQPDRLCKPF